MQTRTFILASCLVIRAQAMTIRVPGDYPTIQDGISAAVDGDLVLVDSGTFSERLNFLGKAITVQGTGSTQTVVDAGALASVATGGVVVFESGEGPNSILRNIGITGGWATVRGGGISCTETSPTLIECDIYGNLAGVPGSRGTAASGGGIDAFQSEVTLLNCSIVNNTVFGRYFSSGGGVDCYLASPTIMGCLIESNVADEGGGLRFAGSTGEHPGSVAHCSIKYNGPGSTAGGGVYLYGTSPSFTDCDISENAVEAQRWSANGGGIYCGGEEAAPTFLRCNISANQINSNWGDVLGGGIYINESAPRFLNCNITDNRSEYAGAISASNQSNPEFTNCLIARNYGERAMGGIKISWQSSVRLVNTTLVENSCPSQEGAITIISGRCSIENSILWGNSGPGISADAPQNVSFSNVEGGYPGPGNLDQDPIFISRGDYNYALAPGSPCIDTGTGGNDGFRWDRVSPYYARHNRRLPDMGAYGGPLNKDWILRP